jgi:pimeloyl-[acyl-carrier protein] methyl ester esterase
MFTPDLPGHGHAPLGAGLDLESAVQGVVEYLPRAAVVVGWSLGGLVAIRLASRFPGRVARLALVATNPRFTRAGDWPRGVDPAVLATFAEGLVEDPAGTLKRFLALQVRGGDQLGTSLRRLREALEAGGAPDEEALRQGLALLAREDLRAELQGLRLPVSLLLGARDTIVPVGVGEAMTQLMPDLRVETVPGAAHAPFLSHPQGFAGWLERLRE